MSRKAVSQRKLSDRVQVKGVTSNLDPHTYERMASPPLVITRCVVNQVAASWQPRYDSCLNSPFGECVDGISSSMSREEFIQARGLSLRWRLVYTSVILYQVCTNSQKLTSLFSNISCSFLDLTHHPQVRDQETRTRAGSRPRGTAISETVDGDLRSGLQRWALGRVCVLLGGHRVCVDGYVLSFPSPGV
jgi:hypothetical protein